MFWFAKTFGLRNGLKYPSADAGAKLQTTVTNVLIGVAVVLGLVILCGVGTYFGYSWFNKNPPPLTKAVGPRVKSSRPKKRQDEEGVSMSAFLSASDIEDHLSQMDEMQTKSSVVSHRNTMN